jgi:uncharacterized protein YodC (DUF2158 family)
MSFNLGDVVRLKSGGPLMTVTSTSISPDRPVLYMCEWIDRDQKLQSSSFPAEALELHTPPTPTRVRPARSNRRI